MNVPDYLPWSRRGHLLSSQPLPMRCVLTPRRFDYPCYLRSLFVALRFFIVHLQSPLGPVDPSFRALYGRLKFTVRRHKFNKDSLIPAQKVVNLYQTSSRSTQDKSGNATEAELAILSEKVKSRLLQASYRPDTTNALRARLDNFLESPRYVRALAGFC